MKQIDIESFLSLEGYDTETRKSRRKNSDINTQEFFTPYEIVKKMTDKISDEDWSNPEKTFCDPCMGNGQFIVYIIWNRLQHGIDVYTAVNTCFGVELMEDNVRETRHRIIQLLDMLDIYYDEDIIMDTLLKNLVCADFFKWNFEQWRPYSPEELKKIAKKK